MALLPVDEAIARLLAGVEPLAAESVPLAECLGRVLASDVFATRDQPPFPASAMDGYAVHANDTADPERWLTVIGESRAGLRFDGSVAAGEAVRIFTGAPVPDGADAVLIQENATRDGDRVRATEPVARGRNIRPAGLDFRAGDLGIAAGTVLGARTLALAAALNLPALPVRRRPVVAVISTGDELVPPGGSPGPDQIISSNGIGISALAREAGADGRDLGIAPDNESAIAAAVQRARTADVIVLVGGASVGDHDLVQPVLVGLGMELDFWKIAMRPGKPLMVGRLGGTPVLGLPGNPVSALVCAKLFLRPLIRAMLGLQTNEPLLSLPLGTSMAANDVRQDYVRARIETAGGANLVVPLPRQDSSMLSALAKSNGLIVRPPHAPAAAVGENVAVLLLEA